MSNRFWLVIALFTGILGASYLSRAFLVYFRVPPFQHAPGQIDVHRRWEELHYVLRGRNPYDVAFAHATSMRGCLPDGQSEVNRDSNPFEDLGVPEGVVYPPWAFPSETLFYWPGKPAYLYYYGLWMFVGIAGVVCWSGLELRKAGGSGIAAMAAAACVFACAAWGGAVIVGNNPPIVVGLLVLMYALLQSGHDIPAGIILGLAMLKPTVAGPFVLPLLATHRWKTLLTSAVVISGESTFTCIMTRTDPVEMLRQMFAASKAFAGEGFGPAQYLMHAGVREPIANSVTATVILGLCALAIFVIRNKSLAGQFAIAALGARLWSYHLYYDDVILIFALVYYACRLQRNHSALSLTGFLLLAISLWLPGRLQERHLIQAVLLCVWIAAAVGVMRLELFHTEPPKLA